MRFTTGILFTLVLGIGIYACSGDESTEPPPPPGDTWQVVGQILNANCTQACHTAGTSFARQSDLVLTPDVAYSQLIDRAPSNQTAKDDGRLLVPGNACCAGLEALAKSFLWEKINAPDQEHFYSDHPFYGAQMPLGDQPLTNGELSFIMEWILAGAPQEGVVADEKLLDDITRFEPPAFQPLAPPADGIQFHLGPFEVAPNYEREFFYFAPVGTQEDLIVDQIEISMRPSSHHFIMYTYQGSTPSSALPSFDTYRDLRDANNAWIWENLTALQYHNFVAGTQWPLMNYTFPPGIGVRIPHFGGLDLNSHYVNRTNTALEGEIYANLHYADPAGLDHVASILWLNHDQFRLPARQVTTLERTFTFSQRTNIIQLFSHAHEHMEEFRAYIVGGPRNGELVYFTLDWEHPPILELNPALTLSRFFIRQFRFRCSWL